MNTIPTADEFQDKYLDKYGHGDISLCMIEFVKLHCEAQAKEIVEKVHLSYSSGEGNFGKSATHLDANGGFEVKINEDSILNAYPTSNIK